MESLPASPLRCLPLPGLDLKEPGNEGLGLLKGEGENSEGTSRTSIEGGIEPEDEVKLTAGALAVLGLLLALVDLVKQERCSPEGLGCVLSCKPT